jgi:hypothetical protein
MFKKKYNININNKSTGSTVHMHADVSICRSIRQAFPFTPYLGRCLHGIPDPITVSSGHHISSRNVTGNVLCENTNGFSIYLQNLTSENVSVSCLNGKSS